MEYRHLQCMIEIVRQGSFTKAAEALHITQPTISKTIKNMEEELGVLLFVRDGRKGTLTDAGKVLYEQAELIASSFRHLSLELNEITNFRKGNVRLGLPPMIGSSFFPEVMSRFRASYPGLTVQVEEEGSKRLEAAIDNGTLDVAVVLLPTDDELFDSYTFVDEKIKLIVHPSHRLADRDEVDFAELAQEEFILFRQDFALHDRVMAECVRSGFRPSVMYHSAQWDFIGAMVAADLGISFLPERICKQIPAAKIRVIPNLTPAIPWRLAMIWKKSGYLSFAAREWIRFTGALLRIGNPAVD